MTNQLTVGQRIDVYEVVDNPYGHQFDSQYLQGSNGVGPFKLLVHDWFGKYRPVNFRPSRVKKVGTFIIKSLKGANP